MHPRGIGGEAGIRTLDTGFGPYNGLANRRLQPLGHLTLRLALLAQGEPQTVSVREIRTCRIQLFLSKPTTVFQTAAFEANSAPPLRRKALASRAGNSPRWWYFASLAQLPCNFFAAGFS